MHPDFATHSPVPAQTEITSRHGHETGDDSSTGGLVALRRRLDRADLVRAATAGVRHGHETVTTRPQVALSRSEAEDRADSVCVGKRARS